MRINVYSQELTSEVMLVGKNGYNEKGETQLFKGVRLFLKSSPLLHFGDDHDDRSAVTLWLPKSAARRKELAGTLRKMSILVDGVVD